MLEFETRIEMLLSNKEYIKEMKDVSIHQLLALKAYIMELDLKIKSLISSNEYSSRKYHSYKEKYGMAQKEKKQLEIIVNSLKTKILGYDQLVLKLQGELEKTIKFNENELSAVNTKLAQEDTQSELFVKKMVLLKNKLALNEKYSAQELDTVKLAYETKIMDLTIRLEEAKNLKDTLELYKLKNE